MPIANGYSYSIDTAQERTMDSQEAYERRTFNEYSEREEADEARSDAIETLAGEIAAGIEAALKSGAEIQSRVYPGAKQIAVDELACWAEEYSDAGEWLRKALAGEPLAELHKQMADAYADSFVESEFDTECERNAAEAADDRSRGDW